jgi:hypothetical protein
VWGDGQGVPPLAHAGTVEAAVDRLRGELPVGALLVVVLYGGCDLATALKET